jgi:hypothetical protein
VSHTASKYLVRVALVGFLFSCAAFGAPLCLTGSATTFCVSDSGNSNQWFSTNPPQVPNVNFNLLGETAQFLVYTLAGGGTVGRWLSPTVDGNVTGTAFVTAPGGGVSSVSASEAVSTITDGTVNVGIDSKVINNNINQTFTITNIGSTAITSLELVEYFHYYPYGAATPGQGTLSFELVPTIENTYVAGLWAHGNSADPGFVREGGVCGGPGIGCSTPDHYLIDSAANVFAAVGNTATINLGDGATSRAMNSAGALSWTKGGLNLTNGQSQSFTVELVPEPATFGLIVAGGLLCWVGRRRR